MRSRIIVLPLLSFLCVGLVLSAGCVSKGKYNSAIDEKDKLAKENADLSKENAELSAQKQAVTKERDDLAAVAAEQDAELSAMQSDYDRLASMFAMEIESNELRVQMLVDGIELAIPSDVLYESGSATASVGSEGIEQVKRIAEFLKETDYFISVVGHTDNKQPSANLAKKYPTNWDLAAARAANAVKFLASQGVDPTRMVAVSRGEFDPIASNDTADGRAQNRRIQVILRQLPEE